MPYTAFQAAAEVSRHDLEVLAGQFGASIEQVAHRLSTLAAPRCQGCAVLLCARRSGRDDHQTPLCHAVAIRPLWRACPLWNVHRAFETPGRFLRQLAETPDGVRYISLARDITKTACRYGAPVRRFAIALGARCVMPTRLIYADGLDLSRPRRLSPSASPAASASARGATSAPCRRWRDS